MDGWTVCVGLLLDLDDNNLNGAPLSMAYRGIVADPSSPFLLDPTPTIPRPRRDDAYPPHPPQPLPVVILLIHTSCALLLHTAPAWSHRAWFHSLVPQGLVARNETSIARTLGHGTKIRYISIPDVHNLYSRLPEPKLLDHGTEIRYISVPEVPTRYRTKKYISGYEILRGGSY
eukprot:SAG11_NODE_380_length_9956_cov_6.339454_3_plen_174_part_00